MNEPVGRHWDAWGGRVAQALGALFLVLALCGPALAQPSDTDQWLVHSSLHCVVRYRDAVDLERFHDKLNFNPALFGLSPQFNIQPGDDTPTRVGKKADALFERVQVLLDMRTPMDKVFILLYRDYVEIRTMYASDYARGSEAPPRSWYLFEYKSIFINLDDLFPGMLAHEMAHHVIDNYLQIRPAAASAEMLAVYAEKHLFD